VEPRRPPPLLQRSPERVGPDRSRGAPLAEPATLGALAGEFGGTVDAEVAPRTVRRVVSPEDARSDDDLVLVIRRLPTRDLRTTPGAFLCDAGLSARVPGGRRWSHAHALWVVTRLVRTATESVPRIHPTAVVDESASIDPTARVGAGAVIRGGVSVGPHCVIGEGAVLHPGTRVGARVVVGPNAVVGRPGFGFTPGPDGALVRVPQLGGVDVGDDAEIGPLCTVDAGTLGPTCVGARAKLDAHVHVAHNVRIGEGTLVAAQSGFAGSSRIGAGVLVGGQVGVTDHAEIGDGARLAARSGVISDVGPDETVAGYPALPRALWLRAWATLLRTTRRRTPGDDK